MSDDTTASEDIQARYFETESERVLVFERGDRVGSIAQNREGYAMLKVRRDPDDDELERYYGFEMALDHVGELLAVSPDRLPVPPAASDMGM